MSESNEKVEEDYEEDNEEEEEEEEEEEDPYDVFMGGSLKLKTKPLVSKTNSFKKKKRKKIQLPKEELTKIIENEDNSDDEVQMTKTEREFQKKFQKKLIKMAKKEARSSHREKIEQFNQKLDSESEHFDIPKVGPG
eukprot:TRINITY_DN196_c0_g1_i1.p1 TRINITY_DN196_c0_g1~~TRINITY_DN196_c0_g1_i1.p1  ORF type:complete len:137 (+),score=69.39 TRINITY_DN196_c0_g1_i1:124-534(+)